MSYSARLGKMIDVLFPRNLISFSHHNSHDKKSQEETSCIYDAEPDIVSLQAVKWGTHSQL